MSEYAQAFINHLIAIKEHDRGAFAHLRRSLGFEPGAYPRAYPYVERFVGVEKHADDPWRKALYLTAGLYAFHPQHSQNTSLAAAFGRLARQRGSASLEHDRAVLEQAGQRREPVLILAQGWEPPTGELADFLDDARQQWGEDTVIALVPLAADPGGALSDATLAQWRRFVDRRQHPHLRLCRAPEVSS